MQDIDFSETSSQQRKRNPSSLKSNRIITENKILSKSLNKYFKRKLISEKEIQKFLIQTVIINLKLLKKKKFILSKIL